MKLTTAQQGQRSTPKAPSPESRAALEAQLREDTLYLLEIIWELSSDESFEQLAQRAQLSTATIYRLWGGIWKRPQLLTIQKLAQAVGLELSLTQEGIAITLSNY